MEEAFKMRNLLQEFLIKHDVRYPTILGLREHIFTGRYFLFIYLLSSFLVQHRYLITCSLSMFQCIIPCVVYVEPRG